ncbi:sensor histidine kinase [Chloroflexota bacterium]
MFSSLRFRLWLTYVFIVGVVICVAGAAVIVYLISNPAEARQEIERLRLVSTIIMQRSDEITLPPGTRSVQRWQGIIERADKSLNVRIAIFNPTVDLAMDSRAGHASPLPPGSILLERRPNRLPAFRDEEKNIWLYTVRPMRNSSYLVVMSPRPETPVFSILRNEFVSPYLRGIVLALILSLLAAFWIARWITAPLEMMAVSARSLADGGFQKIPLEGPREIQTLIRTINDMGEQVEASQQSQRDFIANVSHDLKTPLTSIQGFAQAILDGTATDPTSLRKAAGVIYEEAGRMYHMVLDLLDLARMDSGIAEFRNDPVDINDLLEKVVDKFTPQAKEAQVELLYRSEVIPVIRGDADKLTQVFSNLLDNAVKYTPPAGQVVLTSILLDEWLEVQVSDTGPGITPVEFERIFDRFYQEDKSRHGNTHGVGLGLAIAREIVIAHDGSISVINRANAELNHKNSQEQGSIFIVRLPI